MNHLVACACKRKGAFHLISALAVAALLATAAFAQDRSRTDPAHRADVRPLMRQLEPLADTFEQKFELALDKSTFDGTDFEERLQRLADTIEDEADNMAEDFKENDTQDMVDHFENAMMAAAGLNRVMLDKSLSAAAETEWRNLREHLNMLAKHFHRPVLPNMTVVTLVPVTTETFSRAEFAHVMDRMESATDRFREKFEQAIQNSTANMTDREDLFLDWSRQLEDVTDEMRENFKEKDTGEFQEEIQNTLVVADVINRLMVRSDLAKTAHLEWDQVRKDLNTIAGTLGYPVLPDTVVQVNKVSAVN
jgi:hypothetical protein